MIDRTRLLSDLQGATKSLIDDLRDILDGKRPDLSARTNSAIIGPAGGVLYVDLHHLYVPAGAVTGPTKFEMTLRKDYGIGVTLTATSIDRWGRESRVKNDVGSRGFRNHVQLTFSYAYANKQPRNPRALKVVEVRNGRYYVQPSQANPFFKMVTGRLQHFSDYALAWPGG